jgi:uncharacterized protein YoxC
LSEEKHGLQRQADRAKPNGSRSVLLYMVILFAAAVVLLLLAFFMQKRTNDQTIDGLKQSVSAMQSVQQLYEENAALKEQVDELEDELKDALISIDGLTDTVSNQEYTLKQTQIAMDYFWQIDESYVRGRYTLCRSLIEVLEDNADGKTPLKEYLPAESATDNGRFSPYDRYQEIYDALY